MSSQKIDVIIFGASGFSGKIVVQELYEIAAKEERHITWGIAGRSLTKLQDVLRDMEVRTSKNFDKIPVLEADTKNEASLMEMASKARLVVNCTGPFKFHGEPVVRACIQKNCHYADICAEPQFMERMQWLYNEEAAAKGVYVVSSCGFDNIPTDMGLNFLQKNFDGTLNAVECYLEVLAEEGFGTGSAINYGTLKSAIHVISDYSKLKKIRKELFQKEIPPLEPTLSIRRFPHQIPMSKHLAGPYPGGEATVMRRSQRYFYEKHGTRPIQIHTYIGSHNFLHYMILFVTFLFLLLVSKFQFMVNLILKYPEVFTLGFSGSEPYEKDRQRIQFITTLRGRGWKGKVVDTTFKQSEDNWIVARVSGSDAYKITGICTAVSALVLLDSTQTFPEKGGVFTTAPFFTDTNLIEMLQRNGLKFEVSGQGNL